MKHARKFIEAGNRVKATVLFRGREMAHQEFGVRILERLVKDLEDIAKMRLPQLLFKRWEGFKLPTTFLWIFTVK